jgi:hypothetical protein
MALLSFPPLLPDVSVILRALARQSHPVCNGPVGLKMPDFALYDAALGNGVDDVASMCAGLLSGRAGPRAERMHQMRPDLGRLAERAEIVQI